MEPLQAMMNGLSAAGQKQRAESQMTLGKLVERLAALPPDTKIGISRPHSYRGYYDDLAFEYGPDITAQDALEMCRECMGEVFIGYKGGEFQMGKNTPVWIARYGSCGQKIIGVRDDGTIDVSDDE